MTQPSKVGASTFTTPSDTELVMKRLFAAPRHRVFDAWTNPKHLPNWMVGPDGWTMPVCEVDLRVGGAWHCARRRDGHGDAAGDGTVERATRTISADVGVMRAHIASSTRRPRLAVHAEPDGEEPR